jgi:hypothetical protein
MLPVLRPFVAAGDSTGDHPEICLAGVPGVVASARNSRVEPVPTTILSG